MRSLLDEQLSTLELLAQATRSNKLEWNKVDDDLYEAWLEEDLILVQFARLVRKDRSEPERHMVDVTGLGFSMLHAAGTEGYLLVQAMVDPEAALAEEEERAALTEAQRRLRML